MESLKSIREGLASGRLIGCKALKIADELSEFPMEILALADSLELLVLSENELRSLPSEFAQLKRLKIVFFNNNKFESFPTVLANCPRLSMISFKGNAIRDVPEGVLSPVVRWLILTDNQIATLPRDIGRLNRLQKLMLAGNALRSLPQELSNCERLELIRLSANQLTEIPSWLFSLPKLTWLAYAGNPCCETEQLLQRRAQSESQLPIIEESAVKLGEILGQGASGIIYQGDWQGKAVAVKLFKGEITSDGLPIDEMRACIEAGSHPNIVSVLGRLRREEETIGLVFSFISDDYQNLGEPPSLESCTRDTYDENAAFSLSVVLTIAKGIAGAVAHLHSQGITHGDLYAHNILTNESGESILGDFGAASFFEKDEVRYELLTRLESRAFGCLLEDLLERCAVNRDSEMEMTLFKKLKKIQQSCLSSEIGERPLMKEIHRMLT